MIWRYSNINGQGPNGNNRILRFDKKLVFLLTKYVMALEETKMQGGYFPREQAPGYNIHLASYKDL